MLKNNKMTYSQNTKKQRFKIGQLVKIKQGCIDGALIAGQTGHVVKIPSEGDNWRFVGVDFHRIIRPHTWNLDRLPEETGRMFDENELEIVEFDWDE